MEKWIDISGYEGIYQINDVGDVRSLDREDSLQHRIKGRIMKPKIIIIREKSGDRMYKRVTLCKDAKKKSYFIHRLVYFNFNRNKFENRLNIHFKNDNSLDCQLNNLFEEPILNIKFSDNHKRKIGISLKGIERPRGKDSLSYGKHHTEETKDKLRKAHTINIKEEIQQQIITLYILYGKSAFEIGKIFGMKEGKIYSILKENNVSIRSKSEAAKTMFQHTEHWMKGYKHTEESKKNMSIARKGKPKTEEHKNKLRAILQNARNKYRGVV